MDGERAFVGHQDSALVNDKTLQGGLVPQIGKKIADRIYIEAAARDILGPGVIAPFEDQDLHAVSGQGVGGGQTREAGAYNDNVKFFHLRIALSGETEKPRQTYLFFTGSAIGNNDLGVRKNHGQRITTSYTAIRYSKKSSHLLLMMRQLKA
jgi:hypothetical protein